MLLYNSIYSNIILYTKEINKYLKEDNIIKTDYKYYDKDVGNFVYFSCFDLKNSILLSESIFFKEINYVGYLRFSYNKKNNEVFIEELPYIECGDIKIFVFTNDIASIVTNMLKKYVSHEDINIKFYNDLSLIAMDNNSTSIIPSLINTPNYRILKKVERTIAKEEELIRNQVLNHSKKAFKYQRKREHAIAKKRKIFGLDPNDFLNQVEFEIELTNKLTEMWQNKKVLLFNGSTFSGGEQKWC